MFTEYTQIPADAQSAIAHARVTGSVGCTYNGTNAQRLYTHQGGIGGGSEATNLWVITFADGTQTITDGS